MPVISSWPQLASREADIAGHSRPGETEELDGGADTVRPVLCTIWMKSPRELRSRLQSWRPNKAQSNPIVVDRGKLPLVCEALHNASPTRIAIKG